MDHAEEQEMEMEALESILGEEGLRSTFQFYFPSSWVLLDSVSSIIPYLVFPSRAAPRPQLACTPPIATRQMKATNCDAQLRLCMATTFPITFATRLQNTLGRRRQDGAVTGTSTPSS